MRKMPPLQLPLKVRWTSTTNSHFAGVFVALDPRQLRPKRFVSPQGFLYKFIYSRWNRLGQLGQYRAHFKADDRQFS
jgi:hypothetical protein